MKTPLLNNNKLKNALLIVAVVLFCSIVLYLDFSFQNTKNLQLFLFVCAVITVISSAIYGVNIFLKERKRKAQLFYQKNQLFTSLLNNTASVIFVKDLDSRYLFINKECEKRFHINNNEIIGKKDHEIFSKETADSYLETDLEVIKTQSIFEREESSVHVDGIHTYINTKFPLFDENNKMYAICGIGTDITSRKKAEEEIIHAKEEAERAREMEEHFLANASHEIRTPMNGIIGMARQLIDGKLNEEQKEITNTIIGSANNLLTIINDLLDLSKIKAGKMELEEDDFRLNDIFKKLEQTLHYSFRENHIKFSYQIDEAIPEALFGDAGKINQILMNLIGNSIKFTYEGEIAVKVNLKHFMQDQLQLELNVSDTGIGIPKDKLDRIFDSFTQVSQSDSRKQTGTGLGLTIAKQLIEQQGGNIIVSSKLGQGSVFSFTLLLKQGSIERIQLHEKTMAKNLETQADFSKVNVLLVEDNKINQRVALHEMEKWKTNVDVANDAKEAFQFLHKKKYDVILMDLAMPDIDGYEATVHIRKNMTEAIRETPIIAMTASALITEKNKCFEIGMNDYISKPFEPIELQQKIAKYASEKIIITKLDNNMIVPEGENITDKMATYEMLNEHANGDTEYIAEILEDCINEFPKYMAELNIAEKQNNLEEVKKAAHKLKAPIALIGAESISKILLALEENIGRNINIEFVPKLTKEANILMRKLLKELEEEVEKIHSTHQH